MTSFESHKVDEIFEQQPVEVATWLISLEAMKALASLVKHTNVIHLDDELAAKRLVKSVGAGDYQTSFLYMTRPDLYPPGMLTLATKIGAYTLKHGINSSLGAALSFRSDESLRSRIDNDSYAIRLYDGASDFPQYFVRKAEGRLTPGSYGSVVDTLMTVKTETNFWIDRDIIN